MADPIRLLVGMKSAFVRPNQQKPTAGILFRAEPLAEAMRLLSSGNYRIWFEPQWSDLTIAVGSFKETRLVSLNTHLECAIEMIFIEVGWQVENAIVEMEGVVRIHIKNDYTPCMQDWSQ